MIAKSLEFRCDYNYKKTFLDLIGCEHLPKAIADKVQRLQQSVSGFVVHLGVKMDLPKSLHCGCNMFYPDYGIGETISDWPKRARLKGTHVGSGSV